MTSKLVLEEKAHRVRTGADFRYWKKALIIELQDYALSINDLGLYDWLEVYWTFRKYTTKKFRK